MHAGISRIKYLARQHVWWPGIDLDLERKVKGCNICQTTHHNPQQFCCTLGSGLNHRGSMSMLIIPSLFLEKFSSY